MLGGLMWALIAALLSATLALVTPAWSQPALPGAGLQFDTCPTFVVQQHSWKAYLVPSVPGLAPVLLGVVNVPPAIAATLTCPTIPNGSYSIGYSEVHADGTEGTNIVTYGPFLIGPVPTAALSLTYNGMIRDKVGQGVTALAPDGAMDGTITATLQAPNGRTITALRLDSAGPAGPGTWDTGATTFFVLGVAATLDGALLNSPTMAVNFPVADGGSFVVFAADYQNKEFTPGRTLVLSATFSDGSTAVASTTIPTLPAVIGIGSAVYVNTAVNQVLNVRPGPTNTVPPSCATCPTEPRGALGVVLAGPVDANGITWWQVQFPDKTGWCSGVYLSLTAP